jgi:hypothetical protein
MCAATGITGEVVLRPYLHLTAAERAAGRIAPREERLARQTSAPPKGP